jgi:hypothetical protein
MDRPMSTATAPDPPAVPANALRAAVGGMLDDIGTRRALLVAADLIDGFAAQVADLQRDVAALSGAKSTTP